ncbi:putative divalent cation/proton antiporter TMEM165 isoform X1 [Centruroides vittatus]|uniref:putative divalent cation/proton antiporter TMEM165 isoform X1 n=1 Tax=Centruroides vittatus TaxID=120091 RepID=UPI00350EA1E0
MKGIHVFGIAAIIFVTIVKCEVLPGTENQIEDVTQAVVIVNQEKTHNEFKWNGWSEASLIRYVRRSYQVGFIHAFVASLSVIVVSELGDKTFFIAAILAMHHSRLVVFLGAMTALVVMTILSAFLGYATTVIPRIYTHYISTALFFIFGLKMLKDGYYMSPYEGQAEYEEVQKSITNADEYSKELQDDVETGITKERKIVWLKRKLNMCISRVFLESFTMTFLGEWGDRSQLTTIILAAREDTVGVALGAIFGHGGCTSLAVIGGRFIAQKISVRTVTFLGGILFLLFAVIALIKGP